MHSCVDGLKAEPSIQTGRRRIVVENCQLGIFCTGSSSGIQHGAKDFLAIAFAPPGSIHFKIVDKQLPAEGALFNAVPDDGYLFRRPT